jgi:BMFP domain-containing protein YqiC
MGFDNRLFDDLARVATGALSAFSGVREEAEARLREQFERILSHMDLVTRDEFEAVQAVAVRAREAQETLEARIQALEAKLAQTSGTSTATKSRSRKPKAE